MPATYICDPGPRDPDAKFKYDISYGFTAADGAQADGGHPYRRRPSHRDAAASGAATRAAVAAATISCESRYKLK